jgi:hypothetical protein
MSDFTTVSYKRRSSDKIKNTNTKSQYNNLPRQSSSSEQSSNSGSACWSSKNPTPKNPQSQNSKFTNRKNLGEIIKKQASEIILQPGSDDEKANDLITLAKTHGSTSEVAIGIMYRVAAYSEANLLNKLYENKIQKSQIGGAKTVHGYPVLHEAVWPKVNNMEKIKATVNVLLDRGESIFTVNKENETAVKSLFKNTRLFTEDEQLELYSELVHLTPERAENVFCDISNKLTPAKIPELQDMICWGLHETPKTIVTVFLTNAIQSTVGVNVLKSPWVETCFKALFAGSEGPNFKCADLKLYFKSFEHTPKFTLNCKGFIAETCFEIINNYLKDADTSNSSNESTISDEAKLIRRLSLDMTFTAMGELIKLNYYTNELIQICIKELEKSSFESIKRVSRCIDHADTVKLSHDPIIKQALFNTVIAVFANTKVVDIGSDTESPIKKQFLCLDMLGRYYNAKLSTLDDVKKLMVKHKISEMVVPISLVNNNIEEKEKEKEEIVLSDDDKIEVSDDYNSSDSSDSTNEQEEQEEIDPKIQKNINAIARVFMNISKTKENSQIVDQLEELTYSLNTEFKGISDKKYSKYHYNITTSILESSIEFYNEYHIKIIEKLITYILEKKLLDLEEYRKSVIDFGSCLDDMDGIKRHEIYIIFNQFVPKTEHKEEIFVKTDLQADLELTEAIVIAEIENVETETPSQKLVSQTVLQPLPKLNRPKRYDRYADFSS